MKDTKGITLIALIITIIVMLILVGVTVTTAINGGLFTASQEAKFKTEVSQIKEFMETQKAVEIADNNGVVPDSFNTENLKQAIPDKLLEKYIDTKLEILFDGNLYYIASNLTEKEIQWCEEIGISGTPGIEAFMNNRAEVHFDSKYKWTDDSTITGIVDLEEVRKELKARYPDAVFSYIFVAGEIGHPDIYALSSGEYRNIKDMLESQDSNAVEKSIYLGATALNVFYNDQHLYLAANPDLNTSVEEMYNNAGIAQIEMVPKKTFTETFNYDLQKYNTLEENNPILENTQYIRVTKYKGTANPVVPGFVIKEDNELQQVVEIASGAFTPDKPIKIDLITLMQLEVKFEKNYNDITLDELKGLASTVFPEEMYNVLDNRYTTESSKDEIFMEAMGYMLGISGYDCNMSSELRNEFFNKYFIRENNRVYGGAKLNTSGDPTFEAVVEIGEDGKIKTGEDGQPIPVYVEPLNLKISEGFKKIDAGAFAKNFMTRIYFPTTMQDATNAFQGVFAYNSDPYKSHIETNITNEIAKGITGYSDYNPFGYTGGLYWNELFEVIQ